MFTFPHLLLRSRVKRTDISEIMHDVKTDSEHLCICGARFPRSASFVKHQKYDCNILNESALSRCTDCGVRFSKERNLIRHREKNCPSKTPLAARKTSYSCTFDDCKISFYKLTPLTDHVQSVHGVEITRKNLVFSDYEGFSKWKEREERSTFSYFSKRHSAPVFFADHSRKINAKATYETYYCQFHGTDKPHHRTRNLKKNKKGRAKTGKICYSHIFVKTEPDGSVNVKYVSSHTHPLVPDNTKFQPLPRSLKNEILRLNDLGFSSAEIYEKIRRSNLLRDNRRDPVEGRERFIKTHNIRYLLRSVEKSETDETSAISDIVKEWSSESYDPILIYKSQGKQVSIGPYADLPPQDFLFGFQTEEQKESIISAEHVALHIDFLYDTEGYGVQMLTLALALADEREYPVANFLMTSTDEDTLLLCMRALKEKIFPASLKAVVGTDPRIFTVIKTAFNSTDCRFYFCHIFVLKQWSKRLSENVKDKPIYDEIMFCLEKILNETSQKEFLVSCERFCVEYLPVAPDFINYFKYYYLNPEKIPLWASFCRNLTVNTNKIVERFHDFLKAKYLSRIHDKSLDKLVIAIAEAEKDYYLKICSARFLNRELTNYDEDRIEENDKLREQVPATKIICSDKETDNPAPFLDAMAFDRKRENVKNYLDKLSRLVRDEQVPESFFHQAETELKKLVNECQESINCKKIMTWESDKPVVVQLTNVPDYQKSKARHQFHDHLYCLPQLGLYGDKFM